MTLFPGANAIVYYNEAGEPLGWDYASYDPYDDPDPDRFFSSTASDNWEPADLAECVESGNHGVDCNGTGGTWSDEANAWVGSTWVCALCGEPVPIPLVRYLTDAELAAELAVATGDTLATLTAEATRRTEEKGTK